MKHLVPLLVCMLPFVSFCQSKKFTFKMGSEYGLPRKTEDLAFLGNDKDGIVNLSMKKEELNVIRFDAKSLNQTSEKVIELGEATKNFNSEIVVDFKKDYYWLHSDWDKSTETESLFYDKIDVTSGKISTSNRKLFEATKIAGEGAEMTGFYRYKTTDKYRFNYNAQRNKLLVSYRLVPEFRNDKKNFDKIGLYVFDEQMNKLWGGEFTMPYTEAIMDNSDFSLDSKGNAYLLAKVYDSEARKEKDKSTGAPAYHYEVLKFTKESKKIITAAIAIDDHFIRESSLVENSLQEMIIACTYSKKSNGTGTDGVFLSTLDQNGKVVKYKNGYYEFPLSELEKFESARKQRRMERDKDYEIPNLKVRNVLIEDDGSVFIACEEYFVVTRTYSTANGLTRTTRTYYYEDILGAKINAAGKFEWLRKIPKSQRGASGRGTMGFKLISDASGYYFLYLDNLKNLSLPPDESPKYHIDGFGGQVMVSKIDQAGMVGKELLFDTREEEIMIFPADFDRINGNQFIGRARLKKNLYKPLMITVN
ncbi:MAG: hypothetical protein Q7T76_17605 [Ferruginibacter sp.]|nr:hypothetical protein [Ferruginibacter sp.]